MLEDHLLCQLAVAAPQRMEDLLVALDLRDGIGAEELRVEDEPSCLGLEVLRDG